MELLTRILVVRHGETAWNVDARIQGQLDIPLNDTGRWQASRLVQAVAHEGLDAVYSSDLRRAHETAQAVMRGAGLNHITTDVGLRERGFGAFEGQTHRDIETRWPEDAARWRQRDIDFDVGGGESLRTFYDRCLTTATRLAAAHPGESIALVAHGGVLDCLYRAATRVDLQARRTWQLGNASINRLLYTAQGFVLVGWGDTGHLDREARDEAADGAGRVA